MRILGWLLIGLMFFAGTARADMTPAEREAALDLVYEICESCHGIQDYLVEPRDIKLWDLTVYRMQSYAHDAGMEFTDEEADQIVTVLATAPPEIFGEQAVVESEDEPSPAAAPPIKSAAPPETPRPTSTPPGRPAPRANRPMGVVRASGLSRALAPAKWMGYLAMGCAVLLAFTGFVRRRMGRTFRPVHHGLALALFVATAIHAIIYLSEFGAPWVSWLWMGILATLVLVFTELVGMVRGRLKRWFLRLHIVGGLAGLVLVLLHWVWIYV
jgi:hypothetical protein